MMSIKVWRAIAISGICLTVTFFVLLLAWPTNKPYPWPMRLITDRMGEGKPGDTKNLTSPRKSSVFEAGWSTGKSEGSAQALSGRPVPTEVSLEMAARLAADANKQPLGGEWQRGWKKGFEHGYKQAKKKAF